MAKIVAMVGGGLATLTPVAAGVWMSLDPLRRKSAAATFLPIADVSSVPDDGMPRQFPVIADRTDAWTGFAAEPIGAVYLRREAGSDTVQAFTATCPHAGCFIELDQRDRCFRCPCHNSSFTLDGGIVSPSPSPRAMDTLECEVRDGRVSVKWENFYSGIEAKEARP